MPFAIAFFSAENLTPILPLLVGRFFRALAIALRIRAQVVFVGAKHEIPLK